MLGCGVLFSLFFPVVSLPLPQPARVSAPALNPKPARISVGGDVKSPQLLDYAPDLTVMRAINAAGGFNEYADRSKVSLVRNGRTLVINAKEILKDPSKDLPLEPGDGIEVPQSFW